MTVAELIAKLQKMPPELPVLTHNDNLGRSLLTVEPYVGKFHHWEDGGIGDGAPDAESISLGASRDTFHAVAIGIER